MELYFPYHEVDRVTKRERWKEMHRWERIQRKRLKISNDDKAKMLKDKTLPAHIRDSIMDELTFPPLLLGPRK